ncbi:hypothetical protein [Mycoplasma bradburyae]|uniref:hypothetical protein n=1 Tax=Mycoplasma bradburyae TaxID=2963128 RepID=UPI0023414D56|nr:hypothetical protein [Mycoplasma bradburyae]MDC4182605.1 hypothetical protein [Mycoplasma bradburyae]
MILLAGLVASSIIPFVITACKTEEAQKNNNKELTKQSDKSNQTEGSTSVSNNTSNPTSSKTSSQGGMNNTNPSNNNSNSNSETTNTNNQPSSSNSIEERVKEAASNTAVENLGSFNTESTETIDSSYYDETAIEAEIRKVSAQEEAKANISDTTTTTSNTLTNTNTNAPAYQVKVSDWQASYDKGQALIAALENGKEEVKLYLTIIRPQVNKIKNAIDDANRNKRINSNFETSANSAISTIKTYVPFIKMTDPSFSFEWAEDDPAVLANYNNKLTQFKNIVQFAKAQAALVETPLEGESVDNNARVLETQYNEYKDKPYSLQNEQILDTVIHRAKESLELIKNEVFNYRKKVLIDKKSNEAARAKWNKLPLLDGLKYMDKDLDTKDQYVDTFKTAADLYPSSVMGAVYKDLPRDHFYESIFDNTETMAVIDKYWKKFEVEIRAGRGEFSSTKLAQVHLDESDIPAFKPLIKFADYYTKSQLEKYNTIRAKLKIAAIKDLSETLTDTEKAKLLIHGILATVRGDFIRRGEKVNGYKLVGHSYNIETRNVAEAHKWYYTENYYGLYNSPSESPKNVGFSAEFASSIFFKAIMGERKPFGEYRDASDVSKFSAWGHLYNTLDKHYGFYGSIIVLKRAPKPGEEHSRFNKYDFNAIDMVFKEGRK